MNALLDLFRSFILIGLGAYGGGMVTIPLIQHEIVKMQGWMGVQEMAALLAIAQMTPGPIAINSATFVGHQLGGIPGAGVATMAVIFPAIVILTLIMPFMDKIKKNSHVIQVKEGLKLGVLSLILFATWSFGSSVIHSLEGLAVAVIAFALLKTFEGRLHPIVVILICGVVGLIGF